MAAVIDEKKVPTTPPGPAEGGRRSNGTTSDAAGENSDDAKPVAVDDAPDSGSATVVPGQEGGGGNVDEDHEYVTGVRLHLILFAVTLACLLMFLDVSIIATAIPRITSDFHSLNDVGWYGSAYNLASAALQPLTGKTYNFFSTKWTFLVCFAFFELGSLICGAATSSAMLIGGRAIAGIGGAGFLNGGLLILAGCVPLHKRPMITGILLGFAQLGVIGGPLLGGAFTQYVTWRWCFYINLPIGAVVALLIATLHIPEHTTKPKIPLLSLPRRLDLVGFILLGPAVVMLLLALQFGGGHDHAWSSPTIIGLLVGSAATLAVFLVWNFRKGDDALIPVPIVRKTVVWCSCLTHGWGMACIVTVSFFLPIYFQSVRDASPVQSGVYMLPLILGQLIFGVLSGFIIGKVGYYIPFAAVGAAGAAVGAGLLSLLDPGSSTGEWVGYQIVLGFGRGLMMQVPMLAIQNCLPSEEVSVAMSLTMFAQLMFPAVFLVVANTIFGNSLRTKLASSAPSVDAGAVIAAGADAFRGVVSPTEIPGVLLAYTSSVSRTFYLGAAVSAVGFVFVWGLGWKDIRKKKQTPAAEDDKA